MGQIDGENGGTKGLKGLKFRVKNLDSKKELGG